MATDRQYRCRSCGRVLPAWLPAAKRPNGAMLLHHLADLHPDQARPYLKRMATEDIATVTVEGFDVMKAPGQDIRRTSRCGELISGTL